MKEQEIQKKRKEYVNILVQYISLLYNSYVCLHVMCNEVRIS